MRWLSIILFCLSCGCLSGGPLIERLESLKETAHRYPPFYMEKDIPNKSLRLYEYFEALRKLDPRLIHQIPQVMWLEISKVSDCLDQFQNLDGFFVKYSGDLVISTSSVSQALVERILYHEVMHCLLEKNPPPEEFMKEVYEREKAKNKLATRALIEYRKSKMKKKSLAKEYICEIFSLSLVSPQVLPLDDRNLLKKLMAFLCPGYDPFFKGRMVEAKYRRNLQKLLFSGVIHAIKEESLRIIGEKGYFIIPRKNYVPLNILSYELADLLPRGLSHTGLFFTNFPHSPFYTSPFYRPQLGDRVFILGESLILANPLSKRKSLLARRIRMHYAEALKFKEEKNFSAMRKSFYQMLESTGAPYLPRLGETCVYTYPTGKMGIHLPYIAWPGPLEERVLAPGEIDGLLWGDELKRLYAKGGLDITGLRAKEGLFLLGLVHNTVLPLLFQKF